MAVVPPFGVVSSAPIWLITITVTVRVELGPFVLTRVRLSVVEITPRVELPGELVNVVSTCPL
jgi:hypothetical protein